MLLALAVATGCLTPTANAQPATGALAPADATTATITGTVQAERGTLLVGASVVALHLPTGIRRVATTGPVGAFELDKLLPGGPYALQVSVDGYRSQVVNNVYLKVGPAAGFELRLASAAVATGTRRTDRLAQDAAVPVDVIDMSALALSGPRTDNTQLLNYVVPSFNSARETSADGADHVDGFSLRGLGVDQTLVLVNGKRRHSSALITLLGSRGLGASPTDLNTLSANALDQVQVLRDGAAAQYGSDAIAGVLNLTMKNTNHGGNVLLNNGIHGSGLGFNTTASVNKGLKLGPKGFLNLTGEVDYRGYTTSKNYDRDPNVWPVFSSDPGQEANFLRENNKTPEDYRQRNGDAQMTNYRASYNAAVPLSDKLRLYSFGTYNYRRGQAVAPWVLPSANPLDLARSGERRLGYQPGINTRIQDVAAVGGLEAKIGAWSLDLSQSIGHNRLQYDVSNTLNPTIGNDDKTAFDAGGLRLTQAVSNATVARFFDKALAGTNVAFGAEFRNDRYGIVSGEADSYRDGGRGRTNLADGTASTPGSQGFQGFEGKADTPAASSRQNVAAFLDVEADVVKNWTVAAAVRYENYSDFTARPTFKLASRLRLAPWLAVRAAFNTGFRAPSLQQTKYEQLTLLPTATGTTFSGIYNNTSKEAQAAGIEQLTAETSRNFSAGLVLQPTKQLSLSVDAYQISINDRISLTNEFVVDSIPALKTAFAANGLDAGIVQFFANALDTRTRGLDVVGSFGQPLGKGTLRLTLGANFNQTTVVGAATVPQTFEANEASGRVGTQFIGQRERSLITTGNPNSKILAAASYEGARWGLTLRGTRFGAMELYDFNFERDPDGAFLLRFDPRTALDLIFTYKPTDALQLALGTHNFLSSRPNTVVEAAEQGVAPGGLSYAAYNARFPANTLPTDRDILPYQMVQQGANGAFFYLKASYNFGM